MISLRIGVDGDVSRRIGDDYTHKRRVSQARRSSRAGHAACQALDEWWGDFRAVARMALKGRPVLLGGVGDVALR
jgi:hypothetical protein